MKRTPWRRGGRLLGVAAFLLAVAGGIAYATIPDSSGVIHACFLNQEGQLRVIDTGATCRRNETPLSWNQTGSQGQQGPPGPAGTAFAFAHITNGTLDMARSKNVVSMTREDFSTSPIHTEAFYCFVLTTTPVNAVATGEPDTTGDIPSVTVAGTAAMSSSPCDPGTSAAVRDGFSNSFCPPPMPFQPPPVCPPPPPPSPANFFVAFN